MSLMRSWVQILFLIALVMLVMYYTEFDLTQMMRFKLHEEATTVIDTTIPSSGYEKSLTCDVQEAELVGVFSKDAKCIDGTRPAFYHRSSASSKWHVHFEGGGWCYSLEACFNRTSDHLGSSALYPQCMSHDLKDYLSNDPRQNSVMAQWHHVLVKYCDGASYAGDSVQVFNGETMYFKGKSNRDDTIRTLLYNRGMKYASEIVISGCSAGGLGIYLGIDQMAAIVKAANQSIKVSAMADSGFFPDYTSDDNWMTENQYPEALIGDRMDFSTSMKNVFKFANVSSGAHPKCIATNAKYPEKCIFAEYLAPHIVTPLFALQPQHDHWQIWHILGKPFLIDLVNEFGRNLTAKLKNTLLKNPRHGAYVDSCIHHCTKCSTSDHMWEGDIKSDDGLTESAAFERWYKSGGNSSQQYFIQDRKYPCHDCCSCKI